MPLFLHADHFSISITFSPGTGELLDELVRSVFLDSSEGPAGVKVVVFSADESSDTAGERFREPGWHSYNIRDLITIHEAPARDLFLCGIEGYPAAYPTLQLKQDLVAFVVTGVLALLSHRLLLIHGALAARDGRGHVLTGPSGVGKSTAAGRLPPPWTAPADDLIAAVETGNGYVLHPLPTWSDLLFRPASFRRVDVNEQYALAGVHFLEKSATDAVEPIAPPAAAERLLHTSYHSYQVVMADFAPEARLRCKLEVLRHAAAITARTPVDVLHVSKRGRFWELL